MIADRVLNLCNFTWYDLLFIAHNALLQIAYEKNTDDNPAAAMWRYRSRITIEHLGFFIEQQKSKIECPILKEFLKQVSCIVVV